MEYKSQELNNAKEVFGLGQGPKATVDLEQYTEAVKAYLQSKDPNFIKTFGIGNLQRSVSISGNESLKEFFKLYKDELIKSAKNDPKKLIVLNKVFASLQANLEILLSIDVMDLTSQQFKYLILGYLFRNLD